MGDANHPQRLWNGPFLQPGGQPDERKGPDSVDLRNEAHVSVQGKHVGQARIYGVDGTIALGTLAVDQVGPDLTELLPCRANATPISRAHPAMFRDHQAVEK